MKVSLKIRNSGIILKTFTHGSAFTHGSVTGQSYICILEGVCVDALHSMYIPVNNYLVM